MGALRSALAAKFHDGNLIVIDSLDLKEAKTKAFRQVLTGFKFNKTALVVEAGANLNPNLELSTRNIAGVEMLYGPEVHPYHLLRHELAVFSQAALEKLQSSLKASAPKRKAEVENV